MPPKNRDIRGFFKQFTVPKAQPVEESIAVSVPKSPRKNQSTSSKPEDAHRVTKSVSPSRAGRSSSIDFNTQRAGAPSAPTSRSIQTRLDVGDGLNILGSSQSSLTQFASGPSSPPAEQSGHGSNDDRTEKTSKSLPRAGTPSTTRRIATAVQIPSPITSAADETPVPREQTQPGRAPNTSFSTTVSTLSSAPISSQSSSRRTVRNGVQAVTNSESGSSDSSDDELMDPMSFVPHKRRKLSSPGVDRENTIGSTSGMGSRTRSSIRLANVTSREDELSWKPLSPPRTTSKFSLSKLTKDWEKAQQSRARIAEVEAALEAGGNAEQTTDIHGFDSKTVAAALADESDDCERMQQAMERTEALQQTESFSFFVSADPDVDDRPFPAECLSETDWAQVLGTVQSRDHACSSGFVSDLMTMIDCPSAEVLEWMANQTLFDPREGMCEAYVEILQTALEHGHIRLESLASLHAFYQAHTIGRRHKPAASADSSQLSQSPDMKLQAAPLPPGLRYVVQIVTACAVKSPVTIQADVLWQLMLLNADDHVRKEVSLQLLVQREMARLLTCIEQSLYGAATDIIGELLFNNENISHAVRLRIVEQLPPTSGRLHDLRRQLALHCFRGEPDWCSHQDTTTSPTWNARIILHLRNSQDFATTESTDYTTLTTLAAVLDIAIDAGFSEPTDIPNAATTSTALSGTTPPALPARQLSTSIFATSASQPHQDVDFDKRLDRLVKQIKAVSSRIRDAGASHLRRTEAKSAMERLAVRLENCVRTRPKPRKSVFGGSVDGHAGGGQRNFLERFAKAETGGVGGGGVNVVDENRLSAQEMGEQGEEKKDSFLGDTVDGSPLEENDMDDRAGHVPLDMLSDREGG